MLDLFDLRLKSDEADVGDLVEGAVVFSSPDPRLDTVRGVILRACATIGRSEEAVATHLALHTGPLVAPLELPFSFRVPFNGPVTWSGPRFSIDWRVIVRLDLPWALDPEKSAELQVKPRRLG